MTCGEIIRGEAGCFLRRYALRELVLDSLKTPDEKGDLTQEEAAKRMMVAAHGPQGAAWLAKRFKRSLRTLGYYVLRLEAGDVLPQWTEFALLHLRDRKGWHVGHDARNGRRYWRVTWGGHLRYTPCSALS